MNHNLLLETEAVGSATPSFTRNAAGVRRAVENRAAGGTPPIDIQAVKARQKATWESGDFGQVAKFTMPAAEEFMARLSLRPGTRVLDAACGTGNLALLAARRGCRVSGLDIASNLLAQARDRAQREGLDIDFAEGDAEAMPYPDASFDLVVSMYGVMFAPRPEWVAGELCRVTKPGGLIALANWTPAGFIGKMFAVFARHVPPPTGLPSPLLWGDTAVVRDRFNGAVSELRLTPRTARMCFPFDPAGTVEFFRRYYGPTQRAFEALDAAAQAKLRSDLTELEARHNVSLNPNETDTPAEYLEIHARRALSPRTF
jgi:SAM-dependent methyltransferase